MHEQELQAMREPQKTCLMHCFTCTWDPRHSTHEKPK